MNREDLYFHLLVVIIIRFSSIKVYIVPVVEHEDGSLSVGERGLSIM